VINPQLVGDSFVFSRKKIKNAKVTAVVPDVLGYLIVGLSEIDDAAFSVPVIDEIVDDTILVAFTNRWRVSRKPRKLFGPAKPKQNLEPSDYRAVLFTYS